jgi:hypothetical protein
MTSFDVPVFSGVCMTMLLKRFSAVVVAMHLSAVRPLLWVSLLPSVALHLTPGTTSCSSQMQLSLQSTNSAGELGVVV